MNKKEFVNSVISVAREKGYKIESSRNGWQIDFGHKKLHEEHLERLFDLGALSGQNDIGQLIDKVAPGRGCTHVPMRIIVSNLSKLKS